MKKPPTESSLWKAFAVAKRNYSKAFLSKDKDDAFKELLKSHTEYVSYHVSRRVFRSSPWKKLAPRGKPSTVPWWKS